MKYLNKKTLEMNNYLVNNLILGRNFKYCYCENNNISLCLFTEKENYLKFFIDLKLKLIKIEVVEEIDKQCNPSIQLEFSYKNFQDFKEVLINIHNKHYLKMV